MELQPGGGTLLVRAGVGWTPGIVGHLTTPDFIREHGVRSLVNVPILGSGTVLKKAILSAPGAKQTA